MTTPSGAQHEAPTEDLFFSTTDARGVILEANETFVRIARHPRSELIGAPHNIIRHPDMPGGAFKVVWDTLEAGEPVCAYVKNLAGDGSTYWAFATITPVNNGYLSVRCRPARLDLRDAAAALYAAVRPQELAARTSGTSARDAAELGLEQIAEGLEQAGFASYHDFMRAALLAEAEERVHQVLPDRPAAPVAQRQLLLSVRQLLSTVQGFATDLSHAHHAAGDLAGVLAEARDSIAEFDDAFQQARGVASEHADDGPTLATACPSLHDQCESLRAQLDGIAHMVEEQGDARAELRLSVSLAQLQAETVGRFTVAVIDGVEDAETSANATQTLVQVLKTAMGDAQRDLETDIAHSSALLTEVGAAARRMKILDMLLGKWMSMVEHYSLQSALATQLPVLKDAVASLDAELSLLEMSVQRFAGSSASFDKAALDSNLRNVVVQTRMEVHV